MNDNLSIVDVATGNELAQIPAGINPHILTASPNGHIIYVINAGGHDREPNAHGDQQDNSAAMSGAGNGPAGEGHQDSAGDKAKMGMGSGSDMGSTMAGEQQALMQNSLWAIDGATGDVLARIPVGMGPTHPIASRNGSRVYVTNTDGNSVTVIDTATWEVITTIPDLPEPHDGELTPDGRLLYLATAGNNQMTVVDTGTFQVVRTFDVGQKARGLVIGGPNGEIAYVTNKGDGTLSIIDVAQDKVLITTPVGQGAHGMRLSPDGQTLYVALSKEDAVAIVDATSGEVHQRISVGSTPEQLDLSGDGRWLVVSNNGDATLSIIDVKGGMSVRTVPVGQGVYGVQLIGTPFTDQAAAMPELPRNTSGYMDLSVEQLGGMMAHNTFTLVNVHIPYQGELPQTDLFIPYDQIGESLDKLPAADAPIVLYCRSGSMSSQAAKTLAELGYTNVYELAGGFNAWQAAGYTLLNRQ